MRRAQMVTALSIWLLAAGAGAALAQSPERPHLTIGGGGGIANPLHGDLQFRAAAWELDVRAYPSRLVALEFGYAEWRHVEDTLYTNIAITGPGPIGRIGRLEGRQQWVTRTAGFNALLRYQGSRIAVWGGGGPAFMDFARAYRQTESDCTGPITCDTFENHHGAASFAVQATAGLDVSLVKRVAAYGRYTLAIPIDDPGSGHNAFTGGVRVVLW